MTKLEAQGLQYIIDLNNETIAPNDKEVIIDIINNNGKIILKQNNIITGVVTNEQPDNFRDIIDIVNSLKGDYSDED